MRLQRRPGRAGPVSLKRGHAYGANCQNYTRHALLQVYKGGEDLMVNDVVHVVGILSLSPEVDGQNTEDEQPMQDAPRTAAARLVCLSTLQGARLRVQDFILTSI